MTRRNSSILVICLCIAVACERDVADHFPSSQPLPLDPDVVEIKSDELQRPTAAVRLSSGVIVVSDAFARGLHFFTPNGRHIRTIGRQGSGPGEYQAPGWVGQCEPDSLFVFDPLLARISVLDSAGTLTRQFVAPRATALSCRGGRIAALMLPEATSGRPDPKKPRQRFKAPIHIYDTKGKRHAETQDVPVGEFGPLPKISGIALSRDRILFSNADSGLVEMFDFRGQRTGHFSLGWELEVATETHFTSDIERQVSGFTDRATRENGKRMLADFEKPEHLPAFTKMLSDPHGNLWISRAYPGESETPIRVVSAEGKPLAEARLSGLVNILEVGDRYILGIKEVDDQPRIVQYSFKMRSLAQTK